MEDSAITKPVLLILGGTGEAKSFCIRLLEALDHNRINVIYSVAGVVRIPKLSCEVISGGFTPHGGLKTFIKDKGVQAILDLTHPYAETMSSTATTVAQAMDIAYLRYERMPWTPINSAEVDGGLWREFNAFETLTAALDEKLDDGKRILLTIGQLDLFWESWLAGKTEAHQQQVFIRSAVAQKRTVNLHCDSWTDIGPFTEEQEYKLFIDKHIDVLVTKNSGGQGTKGKITVARSLGLPIYLIARPKAGGLKAGVLPNQHKWLKTENIEVMMSYTQQLVDEIVNNEI